MSIYSPYLIDLKHLLKSVTNNYYQMLVTPDSMDMRNRHLIGYGTVEHARKRLKKKKNQLNVMENAKGGFMGSVLLLKRRRTDFLLKNRKKNGFARIV